MPSKLLYPMYEPEQGGFSRVEAGRYKKDVIRTGRWHVKDGRVLAVTPSRMDHWVKQFKLMREAGLRVAAPFDHSKASVDNAGFVTDLWREGDTLYAQMDIEAGNEPKIGTSIREVSVAVDSMLRDGTGKVWEDVISHIAPVTEPVVPGQGAFERLAARRDSDDGQETRYILSRKEQQKMPLIEQVKKVLGRKPEENVSEDELSQELARKFESHTETLRRVKSERDSALEAGRRDVQAKDEQVAELRRRLAEGGHVKDDPQPTETELRLRREMDEMQAERAAETVDAMIRTGKLAAKAADAATALLSRGRGMQLRRGEAKVSVDKLFREVVDTLPEGASLDLAERAKRTVELRNPNGQGEGLSEEELEKRGREKALAAQGRKE